MYLLGQMNVMYNWYVSKDQTMGIYFEYFQQFK